MTIYPSFLQESDIKLHPRLNSKNRLFIGVAETKEFNETSDEPEIKLRKSLATLSF